MFDSILSSDLEQAASSTKAHSRKHTGSKRATKSTRSTSVKATSSLSRSSKRLAVVDKDASWWHKALEKQFNKAQRTAQAAEHQRASATEIVLPDQPVVVPLQHVGAAGAQVLASFEASTSQQLVTAIQVAPIGG